MKKPANLDWLRAYMSYQMSLEIVLGGDAGNRTPDTADMSRML